MNRRVPSPREVGFAVGRVTFTEILSQRVLYNVILCGLFLFGMGLLASRLTFLHPERVVLDFGLTSVALSCTALAVLVGASMLDREFERRTIFVALSRPITRGQFVVGKFLGLCMILGLNWLLLSLAYFGLLGLLQGFQETLSNPAYFPALFLTLLQSWVMASSAVFFSTFSSTSVSVVMSVGLYLVGENISTLRMVIAGVRDPALHRVFELLSFVPPDLEYFNLGLRLTYGIRVSLAQMAQSAGYAFFLVLMFLFLSSMTIRYKES